MAYFSRLIALCLLMFSSAAFAAYEAGGTPKYSGQNVSTGSLDTTAAACLKFGQIQGGTSNESGRVKSYDGFVGGSHRWTCEAYIFGSWNSSNGTISQQCPGEFSLQFSGKQGSCFKVVPSCPTGQVVGAGGFCEDQPCPAAGTTEGDSSNAYTTSSRVPSNNLCIGSCSWSAGGVVPSVCANGKCYYYGPFTSNGTACTGEGGAPPPQEPDPAPPDDAQCVSKGQCPGTINGTKVCVPCSSKEGTTSESGSSSSEGTDSSGAPTGGTGTTNTTKETTANCTNGSCNSTTTVTVTAPDGSTTTTTQTESVPQESFCKANPGHIVCKGEDEGTFGGSCASGFQCSGDAVQCAQAQAAWKSACASDVSGMTEQINTGTAAMAAGAASGLGIPGGSDAFDLGSRLSEVPLFGSSGGCPSDVSVNVGGTSYTIAFSAMCPQLQVLGVALMAFAYLIAGFIVFRGDRP